MSELLVNTIKKADGTGGLTIPASAGTAVIADGSGNISPTGIYLGGTGAANYLDDYEEGTWTPVYIPSNGAFTSVTYDGPREGHYVKVGNVVHIFAYIGTDSITVGTASNQARLGGLPFPASDDTNDHVNAVTVGPAFSFGGDYPSEGLILKNQSAMTLYYRSSSNGTSTVLNVTDLGTGTNSNALYFSGSYYVA